MIEMQDFEEEVAQLEKHLMDQIRLVRALANFNTTKTYMIIPTMVAESVPKGIDLRGFFKSPDKPTPAVIPVKAGKIMANTIKKLSALSIFAKISNDFAASCEGPKKNMIKEIASMDTTTQRAETPRLAPFFHITKRRIKVAGMLNIQVAGSKPDTSCIHENVGVKASEKAII